jgi:hypothetical protein
LDPAHTTIIIIHPSNFCCSRIPQVQGGIMCHNDTVLSQLMRNEKSLGKAWAKPGQSLGKAWAKPGQSLDKAWARSGQAHPNRPSAQSLSCHHRAGYGQRKPKIWWWLIGSPTIEHTGRRDRHIGVHAFVLVQVKRPCWHVPACMCSLFGFFSRQIVH